MHDAAARCPAGKVYQSGRFAKVDWFWVFSGREHDVHA